MAKPIIVCADDFAFSEGASIAIALLARLGRVSATSAMVLSPRWAADAPRLTDLRGRLDVGLHLDWTSAFAVAQGHGLPLSRVMGQALAGGFRRDTVAAVIERQLDAFEAQWKAPPDHVDGHQHIHQFRGIRRPLLEILDRRYGRGNGPYLRLSRPVGRGLGLKGWVIGAMGAAALKMELQARDRGSSAALTGLYDFSGTTAEYAARVLGWLRDAPPASVLMCHPASQSLPDDPIASARLREFEFWRGDGASEALAQANSVPARGPAQRLCAR